VGERGKLLERLRAMALDTLLGRERPGLRRSTARRVAEKVALDIVGNRFAAWDPVHESAFNLAYYGEKIPSVLLKTLVEKACDEMFFGYVLTPELAKKSVIGARALYLGKCICRSSGRVNDLYRASDGGGREARSRGSAGRKTERSGTGRGRSGRSVQHGRSGQRGRDETREVYMILGEEESRPSLDGIIDVYQSLRKRDIEPIADPSLHDILEEFSRWRSEGSSRYAMAHFWEKTYPFYEILLDHEDYTDAWLRTMDANNKAWRVHRDILLPWIDAMYSTRGAIFSSMVIFDAPYTICSCPGPENAGGCLLFNWHYYSGNQGAIKYNEEGQRRDGFGNVLPCKKYPERMRCDCLGCGCDHSLEEDSE
jgi:hypothetical protein